MNMKIMTTGGEGPGVSGRRNVLLAAVLLATAVQAGGAVRVDEDAAGFRAYRTGEAEPFAAWARPGAEAEMSVRTEGDAPFVFIDVAPRAVETNRLAGVLELPEIRFGTFTRTPVTQGSAGLKPVGQVSCGYLAVAEPMTRRGVVCAWLTNFKASGGIASRMDADGRVLVKPLADYGRMLVEKGRAQTVDTLVIGAFDDCRLGLEAYADAAAMRHGVCLRPNRTGYCTWCSDRYGYSDRSRYARGCGAGDEASTRVYADLAAKVLKPYGFDFIQFDDQWQNGKELNGPARDFSKCDPKGPYPNGFGPIVRHLNEKGFAAGLWFIPFAGVATEPAWAGKDELYVKSAVEIPRALKDVPAKGMRVLPRKKGDPIRAVWGGDCLDMTNPKARACVAEEVRRFTFDWGFRYLKCDGLSTGLAKDLGGGPEFVEANFSNAVFSDPTASNVSAFRRGLETLRAAAAPGTFLLGCNLATVRVMVPSFGLLDGMRIGADNGPIDRFPERYLIGHRTGTERYFLNGRVWRSDPDSTYVRAATPLGRARTMASWTAISDSLFEVGDWLPDLPEDRVEILRRTMAHHGSLDVRPIDYFENPMPNAWLLDGGRSKVLALFNWNTNETLNVDYPFAYAGLDPAKTYAAYDFWGKRFLGTLSGALRLSVPADDCRIISLAEVVDHPVLLATSRHVASPVIDVKDWTWDGPTATIAGRSDVVAGDRTELVFHVPDGWRSEGGVVRHVLEPKTSGPMSWKVVFSRADGKARPSRTGTKTVKVSDFGYDPEDSTAFIRQAVESDADVIVLDAAAGPWHSDVLQFRNVSNKVIRLEKGVELRAKRGAFRDPKSGTCLMSFFQCSDITLSGYGAAFRMERDVYDKPPYAHSEHRHCLNLRGVRNFRVEGLTFAESGGDGIFIGGSWREKRFVNSENVFLTDVVCDRNYRQGLSIIAVSNFVAQGCVFSNTKGTPPQSGVDIEPNQACEFLSQIVFRNCRLENNAGRGLEFYLGNLNSTTPPVTALLEGCTMTGNVNGFEYQQSRGRYSDLPRGGQVTLRDCTIERSTHAGILIIDKPAESAKLVFRNVTLDGCCTVSSNAPDVAAYSRLVDTMPTDDVVFDRVKIIRPLARPWITSGRIDYTSSGAKAIGGSVEIVTAGKTETVPLDAAWRTAFAPLPPDGPTLPRAGEFNRSATVVDPAPGEMRPLENVVLAGTHRVVFYVESKREVKFHVKAVKLHKRRPLTMKRALVREYTGSKCTYLHLPTDGSDADVTFQARHPGYYAIEIEAGKNGFSFLAANVPLADEIRDRGVRYGLPSGGSKLRFRATKPFSLFAGADSYEKGKVRLSDPSGAEVWAHPLLTDWQRYQGAGAEGLWTLELSRPKSMNRTVGVDLTGVPAFLFLSGDRYWK